MESIQTTKFSESDLTKTSENWKGLGTLFQNFNEERTQVWIDNGFTQAQAKEWLELGFSFAQSFFLAWLRDEKVITINSYKDFNDDQRNDLWDQFDQYCQERDLVYCNWCYKHLEISLMFSTNQENSLDFCSEYCQTKWNDHQQVAQNYLDYWYPKNGICLRENEFPEINNFGKKRSEITELFISGYDDKNKKKSSVWTKLTGTLDLSDFINLEYLVCSGNQLSSLELNHCVKNINNNDLMNLTLLSNNKLKLLDCGNNQLTSLDLTKQINLVYFGCSDNQLTQLILPTSSKLKELICKSNQLTSLDCTNNSHLEKLLCHSNQLTELILPANNQLTDINVDNNLLTAFNYAILNPNTLTKLCLFNNNLASTNLNVFSHLVNLTNLEIGNKDTWIQAGNSDNRFFGSLESLKNCIKLEYLDITNTNINTGLEYLSGNIGHIECSGEIKKELNCFGNNVTLWQFHHPQLMIRAGKQKVDLINFTFINKKNVSGLSLGLLKETEGTKNYNQIINYSSLLVNVLHPFSWEQNAHHEKKFSEHSIPKKNISRKTITFLRLIFLEKVLIVIHH